MISKHDEYVLTIEFAHSQGWVIAPPTLLVIRAIYHSAPLTEVSPRNHEYHGLFDKTWWDEYAYWNPYLGEEYIPEVSPKPTWEQVNAWWQKTRVARAFTREGSRVFGADVSKSLSQSRDSVVQHLAKHTQHCLLYTSPSPRDS